MGNKIKDYLFKNKTEKVFTISSLPNKRKDVFFRLFRYSFSKLLLLSLFTSIFFLLSFAWRIVFDTYLLSLDNQSNEYFNDVFTLTIYYSLPTRLILNIISFLGLAGLFYSVRILSWGMPYKLTYTFFRGIKLSFKDLKSPNHILFSLVYIFFL